MINTGARVQDLLDPCTGIDHEREQHVVALSSIPRTTTWISKPNQQEQQDVICLAMETDTPDQQGGRGVTAASLAFTQVGVGSNPTGLTDRWRVAQR